VHPVDFICDTFLVLTTITCAASDTVCSKEESDQLRKRLRDVGVEQFIRETLMSGKYSALKLCSAFRVVVPGYTEEDEALYPLLGFALHRELSYRRRLEQYQTIDDAASLLNSAKNILVITGAGVS
jgi:NAD-dependent histone deacetylase SIR2